MTNEHVELVKRWLEDNSSVSLEELRSARDATHGDATYAAAQARCVRAAVHVATYARDADRAAAAAAASAAWVAARAAAAAHDAADAAAHDAADAAYWVKKYEEITNDK